MMNKTVPMLVVAVAFGIAIGVIASQTLMARQESPYLKHSQRLGDVVAAILVMGTYEFDSRLPDKWEETIGSRPKSTAGGWSDVFAEHPEFFRVGQDNKVSLVWRRARDRLWDTETRKEVTQEELNKWAAEQKEKRLSREPLKPEETTKLVEIANIMQTQAIARRAELRWWVPVLVGVVGVLIGALIKR
jgi:hypothetical protein